MSLAEESLFRGYIQSRLSEVTSPLVALIVAALLFGFITIQVVLYLYYLPRYLVLCMDCHGCGVGVCGLPPFSILV